MKKEKHCGEAPCDLNNASGAYRGTHCFYAKALYRWPLKCLGRTKAILTDAAHLLYDVAAFGLLVRKPLPGRLMGFSGLRFLELFLSLYPAHLVAHWYSFLCIKLLSDFLPRPVRLMDSLYVPCCCVCAIGEYHNGCSARAWSWPSQPRWKP